MTKKRTYKRYSKEFKLEALSLIDRSDKPVSEVARKLGIRVNQIYKWRHQLESKGAEAFPGKGRQDELAAENKRLKRELAAAREEAEILKKAAAYFAKESL